jgi:hypothetical protein
MRRVIMKGKISITTEIWFRGKLGKKDILFKVRDRRKENIDCSFDVVAIDNGKYWWDRYTIKEAKEKIITVREKGKPVRVQNQEEIEFEFNWRINR